MEKKLFLLLLVVFLIVGCSQEKKEQPPLDVNQPAQSDREPNGGALRFHLAEKAMHDKFFEAQFTPRGDLYDKDNLQLYNYNLGSAKFPQFLISLNYKESELKSWEGLIFPLDFLVFTISPGTQPLISTGELEITHVTDYYIEGKFGGTLTHPENGNEYKISGEFKAIIKVNA